MVLPLSFKGDGGVGLTLMSCGSRLTGICSPLTIILPLSLAKYLITFCSLLVKLANDDREGFGNAFGAAAGDFDIAVQPARVAAVDLVDDHTGFAAGEKGVALYPAGLAGGYAFMAVVENGAARIDVEAAVLVDGYAVGGGGLDIDLRQAVAGLQDDGLLGFESGFVGLDVGSGGGHNQGRTETEQQTESQRAQMQTAA